MNKNQRQSEDPTPNSLHPACLLVSLLMMLIGFSPPSAQAAERQVIHHPLPASATNATFLRHNPGWSRLNLTLSLPLRDREGLTNLLQQLYDPASPNFRHYLTPEQFAERFGPTEEDYQSVIKFAQSHGLVVTGRHPNRTLVDVTGAALSIERAFHVKLNQYQHPTQNRTFYAPDTEPSVDLATPILSVGGLDNFFVPRSCFHPTSTNRPKAQATGSGPGGTYLGNDFRSAYLPDVTLTGAGQTVGLLEFDAGYYTSDIAAYEALANLPNVPVTPVLLDGYNGAPGDDNVEVSVDIEMAISMAPGLAGVLVYEGSTIDDILNRMATDNQAKQLAASWTYAIDSESDQIFLQFAAQGQSFFNASGDGDAYTGAIDPPADDPNITIVGGTTLTTTTTGGLWSSETVWNAGSGEGSGGGISTLYAIPTWQKGISMAANQGSTTLRNVPDVSLTADNIYVIFDDGQEEVGSGTSCSVQLWAAFTALINQLAVTNGEATAGFLNPAIYSIGKGLNVTPYTNLFHDTTNGNNEKSSSLTKFVAVPGYDLCTGWGTPNGNGLITALGLPEPLLITPLPAAVFTGAAGGPFAPASQTFSLANNGLGALRWSLANTSSWFTVSPISGSIAQGGNSDTVTVAVSASATNLAVGAYTTTLRFTNEGDKFGQSRLVTLAVVSPPVITSQPTNLALLEGMTATFSVQTAPNALMSYQWQQNNGLVLKDGGSFSGTATSTLTISNISGSDVGSYSVVLSNAAGVLTSSNAVLTYVHSPPVVVQQPVNQVALPGATASFTVTVVGDSPYAYQWQLNGIDLLNNSTYSGVAKQTLMLTNISSADAGTYSVIVSDYHGSTNSSGAELSVAPVTSPGLTMTTIASFPGGNVGAVPYSPMIQGTDGNFYGTLTEQGADSDGTVFKVTTNGVFTTLATFKDSNGSIPFGGLFLGSNGFFYGSAAIGGAYEDGLLFKMAASGVLTTQTTFNGNNGSEPVASLLQGTDGNFYGTALEGGADGVGTIFRMTASGALTTLVSFNDVDGANPSSALVQGSDGNFYGTTEDGGLYAAGTVFKMSSSGDFTNLYSFTGGGDGASPIPGLVQGADGNYYGTTYVEGAYGYGTVFEITSSGALTTRYSFTGGQDGGNPWGALVEAADGNLYGTTQDYGTYGFGTIFRIAPNGVLSTIGQFDGYIGAYPSAVLVQGRDGGLYGTTLSGGAFSDGAVYRLNTEGPLQITGQPADQSGYTGGMAAFTVATFGAAPVFYQWQQNGINLTNGTGISGANSATLTISNVTPYDAAVYTVVVSNALNSVTSEDAILEVILSPPAITTQPISQTCVVGMTVTLNVTANADQPFTYQWQEDGTNLTDGGAISGSATGALTIANVALANAGTYSVVVSNALDTVPSAAAVLTVLPVASPAAAMTNLHIFSGGADGAMVYGGLIEGNDGNLYGVAEGGGQAFAGTIFKLTTAGSMSTVYSFLNTPFGAEPIGGLMLARNGDFYGTCGGGGVNGDGDVFRLTFNPTDVKILYSFDDGIDGATPADPLVQGADGNFYGTTYQGGITGYGSVFKMTASGTLTTLYGFSAGDDGGYPYAGVIQASDGNFYGTTLEFGADGFGTVYRVTPSGTLDTVVVFNGTNGAFPQAGLLQGPDGNLYGSTFSGGSNGYGTVFSLTTNGTLTTLYSFNNTNGSGPGAALILGSDGNFYGTTSSGGAGGQGTAFRLTTNGTLTTLLWFDGLNGGDPEAPLIQGSDGNFYGTTAQGGTGFNPSAGGGNGSIFQFTVPLFISNSITATPAVAPFPYSSEISTLATAAPGDVLTFSKVSGPVWLQVAPNGALTGTPAISDIGTNEFVVSLTDSSGITANASLLIPVIPDPPPSFVVNPFAEPWASANEAYSANIATNATDSELANGDILTFGIISGPAWLNVASDGELSGTPTDIDAGTNTFVVSVTNLGGASGMATLIVYVESAPSFLLHNFAEPPATAGLNYSATIATNATDPDFNAGDVLGFYKVTGPSWLNVATNGALSGVPSNANLGQNSFVVLVVDLGGLAGTGDLGIAVNAMSAGSIVMQISQQGTNVLLSWSGGSAPYQLQMTTDLANPVWQNLGNPGSATSLVLSPTSVSSYYQVVGQ